jgi:hypothetical protein
LGAAQGCGQGRGEASLVPEHFKESDKEPGVTVAGT